MTDIDELKTIFTDIYENNGWFMGQNESKSGLGSTFNYTENIRKELINFIKEKSINNMLDTSCGDWNWMKTIQNDLCYYTGLDIVKKIVEDNNLYFANEKTRFINIDFLSYIKSLPNKSLDLIFCRHTLEHLPSKYNIEFLNECKRVCKYLFVTGYNDLNKYNIELINATYRPINLELEPYSIILSNYYINKIYDGPITYYAPEAYMYIYDFTYL